MNVPFNQSKEMDKALERAHNHVQCIAYENAEHSIRPESYRIDLLTRLGKFLGRYIGP